MVRIVLSFLVKVVFYFFFSWSKACFLFSPLILLLSCSKAYFLFFFLKSFFQKFRPLSVHESLPDDQLLSITFMGVGIEIVVVHQVYLSELSWRCVRVEVAMNFYLTSASCKQEKDSGSGNIFRTPRT